MKDCQHIILVSLLVLGIASAHESNETDQGEELSFTPGSQFRERRSRSSYTLFKFRANLFSKSNLKFLQSRKCTETR